MADIRFLGAAGTVTGSKYLVESNRARLLVDCGMFQGAKQLRLMNWQPQPFPPNSIHDIVLTHAHIDHCGMLPVVVREGFKGSIWTTAVTRELCELSLLDAAHLQEEDARFANKHGFSKHKPALPLFDTEDAKHAIQRLQPLAYEEVNLISNGVELRFRDAGHILGSAIVELTLQNGQQPLRIVFSGDLGRYNALILRDPEPVDRADYLLIESTYGNRTHPAEHIVDELAAIVTQTAARGGTLVIPSFAIGRTQTLLYIFRELKAKKRIPDLPIYVDSPMAVDVTEVFCRHMDEFDEDAKAVFRQTRQCPLLGPNLHLVRSKSESQELNNLRYPAVILSASGMVTGGRILHHLKYRLPDPRNSVLFVGYQSNGTRGQLIKDGARTIKIHGEEVPVRAQIWTVESLSGHADSDEILRWLKAFKEEPRMTFVVHGEAGSSAALAERIQQTLGWKTHVPALLESYPLV